MTITRKAGSKYIDRVEIISPAGSKVVVKRIRLTPEGREALTTLSEGITPTGIRKRIDRRLRKEPEPA